LFTYKQRPQSNKITPPSNLAQKKKNNFSKKFINLYPKIKDKRNNQVIGIFQKPFDYNTSFIKKKKPSINKHSANMFEKKNNSFSST